MGARQRGASMPSHATHVGGHRFNSTRFQQLQFQVFATGMAQVNFGGSLGFMAKMANPPTKLLGNRVSTKYRRIPSFV